MSYDTRMFYAQAHIYPGVPLTRREVQVLKLAACIASGKDVAQMLGIKHQTVKNHLRNTYIKLRAYNRTDAVMRAIGAGYFSARSVCVD